MSEEQNPSRKCENEAHPAISMGYSGARRVAFYQPDNDDDGERLGPKSAAEMNRLYAENRSASSEIERFGDCRYGVYLPKSVEPEKPIAVFQYFDQAQRWAQWAYRHSYAIERVDLKPPAKSVEPATTGPTEKEISDA